jgi:hypothetical protein
MPELGPYGSVRGARGDSRPYRESWILSPPKAAFGAKQTLTTVVNSPNERLCNSRQQRLTLAIASNVGTTPAACPHFEVNRR